MLASLNRRMKRTMHIIIVLTILTFIGCSESERKTAPKDDRIEAIQEHEKALRVKHEQRQKGDLKTDSAKKNVCSQFSETMIDLKELLELENYKVEIKERQKDLSFKSEMANEVFQGDETISFQKLSFCRFTQKERINWNAWKEIGTLHLV